MSLAELYAVICDRRDHPQEGSYTADLFRLGKEEIMKKVGEEAVEVVVAAAGQTRQRLVEEIADLSYHVLVLMAAFDLTPQDIEAELDRRHR